MITADEIDAGKELAYMKTIGEVVKMWQRVFIVFGGIVQATVVSTGPKGPIGLRDHMQR